jgi:hypothetical protein
MRGLIAPFALMFGIFTLGACSEDLGASDNGSVPKDSSLGTMGAPAGVSGTSTHGGY